MKTYLVIGAGPGMSLATAQKFAAQGFRVVLAARNADRLAELAEQTGGAVETHVLDATDPQAVAALIHAVETQGGIDVLHYNAARIRKGSVTEQPLDSFNADLAVNIGGALAAIHAAAPAMKARGSGTILLTGGGFGLSPHPDYVSLSIGKAGIHAIAAALFDDFRAHGVHVAALVVKGFVNAQGRDAGPVADVFWSIYDQAPADWQPEVVYTPIGN
ncbi:MAG: SDR family NAD(P)-dependent oxidoreductase [Paracoccus sp. (in: a-proteobacteria)]|uniref:SDR family oxidoreductase n=1 Tax=Paracoccus sp. TaxID=267 RepID=UPI0026DEEFB3|nr:SDR family NAD(P)-dependent oxidoreductase [Paracoccus sp. (in: a-proteobacteria)]MDO5613166.1 SDR family NAD(P)-dependent oxidoreductase [Paracoccus sp. (in: a-proteobacteria)]